MRIGVSEAVTAAAFLLSSLFAAAPVQAQAPPQSPPSAQPAQPPGLPRALPPGFVSPYAVTRIARSAGLDPLAPPLRQGTIYVLRATDFRGILMRVVVDARSGAIRAVNRIVPGPGPYGSIGMLPPPYGGPPVLYQPPAPSDFEGADIAPDEEGLAPPLPPPPLPPPITHSAVQPFGSSPPLPRPRPAELAARKALDDARSSVQSAPAVNAPAGTPVPAAAKRPPAPPPMNE